MTPTMPFPEHSALHDADETVAPAYLRNTGAVGEMIRRHDWAATPMGPIGQWPPTLKTALSVSLNSVFFSTIYWGPEFRMVYNQAYCDVLGDKHPSALGRPAREVWPEIWDVLDPMFHNIVETGAGIHVPDGLLLMHRHGYVEECYFDYNVSPIYDEAGKIVGLFNAGMETTRRVVGDRRAALLRTVTERMPGARSAQAVCERVAAAIGSNHADLPFALLYLTDADNKHQARLAAATGVALDDAAHLRTIDLRDADAPWRLAEVRASRTPVRLEALDTWPPQTAGLSSGQQPVVLAYALPLMNASGPASEMLGYLVVGISPRRAFDDTYLSFIEALAERITSGIATSRSAEVERHFTNELARQVAERTAERDRIWQLSQDPFLIADADGHWLRVSPTWTNLLGWTEQELIGRTSEWIEHPDDRLRTRSEVEQLTQGATTQRFENRFRARDGSYRWFAWTAVEAGGLLYCVARDVTAEKEQAANNLRLEAQLRQSQKMEAVGQLTGGLAHDFNNLLTGISGSLELIQLRVSQGRAGEIDRFISTAQNAARRASALTHRLLAFSRQQTLAPKVVDIKRLVAGMEDLIQRTVGPSIAVESAHAAGLWSTLVDPSQLENALLNLCINARDAMPDGGKLMIETGNRWMDKRSAAERDLQPGQYISLCVSDTGTGMSPAVVSKAFDPFFTTKPIGQGTGLGLSMIYGFARQSGGSAQIYSEQGAGAMICIYLPRYLGDSVEQSPEKEAAALPQGYAGRTVLVVDDEPGVRMLAQEVLEEMGYRVLMAPDGPAGMKIIASDEQIDLLITDVGLPGGMNGRQVAEAARAARPGLQILFITGYAENAVLSHGHLAPGVHVLTKPFSIEDLASHVAELIAGA